MPLWIQILAPSIVSAALGAVVGYGRGTARLATMEANIATLQRAVDRLENLMLTRS